VHGFRQDLQRRSSRWRPGTVLEDVATAVPAGVVETAHAAVPSLLRPREVMRAVVLVQGAGAHQPQVTTGDEPAVVEDLVLRLDGHIADGVEQPQQGVRREGRQPQTVQPGRRETGERAG